MSGLPTVTPVINVVGATATGKSDLAVALAQELDGEIINADAMQFYRGMDIGTAKLPVAERGGIPHHLLDVLEVSEDASVAVYQGWARALVARIRERGHVPIIVGGSGLYVRAATDHMGFPGTDPAVRARLEAEADEQGSRMLHARLRQVDPAAAAKIEPGDSRRVVRALEVVELTGEPFSAHLPRYEYWTPTVQIGLAQDRPTLHARIAERVGRMWEAGWVDEVRALLGRGLLEGTTARKAIGYAEILDHLDGRMTPEDAIDRSIVRTRQFAKRQETWFRRDDRIHWLPAGRVDAPGNTLLADATGIFRTADAFTQDGTHDDDHRNRTDH
ncbi:tRNA (adenosine(37)-N6)-dimethylallyltransferase MiaA [Brevibacterium litoralis]|uniref:tRNA (adenosine(37)-N6)-dimethylallyltransferase MiaA n=1 Tax=Brevibacterium litoralis TaxID=3138935 RepID=UPI0032F04E27